MSATQHPILTIGHSNHSSDAFLSLLRSHEVGEVIDVRSSPYSRYNPQFNLAVLEAMLEDAGVAYAFLGGELGGRPNDRSCYDSDGRVLYDRLAETDQFQDGISYVMRHADETRVALMCSEKEPLECHRGLLIARALVEAGMAVEHILADGMLETHSDAMDRLLDGLKLPRHGDMFRSREDVISDALSRQARRVAYVGSSRSPSKDDWESSL
ncbi:MAG: DUF488 domain-containing protein [Chloroflexota bacterium]|nr:DUF488 domain-containing protein [Chloroflexota bacterium]MDE2941375.1 DUF488 domain-containing protein [Chloroflexota bacterium]MDE3267474.1 DUF488 domain-containing protein [Chloroflexota bacterium]